MRKFKKPIGFVENRFQHTDLCHWERQTKFVVTGTLIFHNSQTNEHQPHQHHPLTKLQGIPGYDQLTSASKIASTVSFSKQ